MSQLELRLVALGGTGDGGRKQPALTFTHFPAVVGRHRDCAHRLEDNLISRHHCAFSVRGGRVCVEDLGSRNGTLLNGEPVQGRCAIKDGDQLDLAHLRFLVCVVGASGRADGPEVAAGAARVLVVEDDAGAAQALALLLESWGCAVQVARDGPEALRAAEAEPPDTVFLDIRLPGMSGVEVARRLRSEVGLRDARLVAVTGDETAAGVLSSRAGFAQLLVKPVSPSDLRDALHQPG
jgi:CheY-like chemotaxis protein